MGKHYNPHTSIPDDSVFKEFFSKSINESDPLLRFIYLWIAFEWIITTDENEDKNTNIKIDEFCRANDNLLRSSEVPG